MLLPLVNRSTGGGGISPTPSVPDGKTVTPINSVPIWISCAGIVGCSYTTLGEVLTDVGILEELINNHNAMDYLVRCKNWINGEALVPTMTSNTTPYGEVIRSAIYSSGYDSYYAFDNDVSTRWNGDNNSANQYIGYHFTEPALVEGVSMKVYGTSAWSPLKSYKLQGSNDGTGWSDIKSGSIEQHSSDFDSYIDIHDNNQYYLYIRLLNIESYGSGYSNAVSLYSLQFHGQSILNSERAMYFIGQNNYASDTLLDDSDWLDAICNSQYMEYILNTKVPTMTNYTVPYGTVIEGGHYNAFYGWHPFMSGAKDRTAAAESTAWYSNITGGQWVGYNFSKDVKIYRIETRYGHGAGSVSGTVVYAADYSTDGTTWEEIPSVTFTATISGTNISSLLLNNTDVECQAIRLRQVSGYGGMMTYLQFYGRTNVIEPTPVDPDTKHYIFRYGETYEAETGGWSNAGWKWNASAAVASGEIVDNYIIISSSAANGIGTGMKIDLTDVKYIKVNADVLSATSATSTCILTINSSDKYYYSGGNPVTFQTFYPTGLDDFYFDVSSRTGEWYIGFGAGSSGKSMKIYEIELI